MSFVAPRRRRAAAAAPSVACVVAFCAKWPLNVTLPLAASLMQPGLASDHRYPIGTTPSPISLRRRCQRYLQRRRGAGRGGIIIIIPFPDSKCIRHCGQNERAEERRGWPILGNREIERGA